MDKLLTERLITIIQHLGACRVEMSGQDSKAIDHIEVAYDEAVESLLRIRAPRKAVS